MSSFGRQKDVLRNQNMLYLYTRNSPLCLMDVQWMFKEIEHNKSI